MALSLTWSDALRRGISDREGFKELSHISDVMWRQMHSGTPIRGSVAPLMLSHTDTNTAPPTAIRGLF